MSRVALALLFLGCAKGSPLPPHFLWGASIAGFQVDMGCPTLSADKCEDRGSDWYQLITHPAEFADLKDTVTFEAPSRGPGHWELWEKDLELAGDGLGLNAFRFSFEWSRVFPTATDGAADHQALLALADRAALDQYHAILAGLKARGLRPLVTLNHYTLPLWMHDGLACHRDVSTCAQRGWLDSQRIQKEIAKYAGFMAREFAGEVDLWATQNEPFAVVLPGYLFPSAQRVNPPALSYRFPEAKAVMVALIEAHARMYDAVKANDRSDADGDGQAALVGLVYATVPMRASDPNKPIDQKAAQNLFYLYNTVFLDAVCRGDLDATLGGRASHRDDLANRMDWLGVNYYTSLTVKGTEQATFPALSPLTNFDPFALMMGAEAFVDDPKGLYETLLHLQGRYGLPMYITENGTPVDDLTDSAGKAKSFLVRHLQWMEKAVQENAQVRGYFFWSLFDNYEWNHGMKMRFGLYAIDPDDPKKTRQARPAVSAYAEIARQNGVPAALAKQYPIE